MQRSASSRRHSRDEAECCIRAVMRCRERGARSRQRGTARFIRAHVMRNTRAARVISHNGRAYATSRDPRPQSGATGCRIRAVTRCRERRSERRANSAIYARPLRKIREPSERFCVTSGYATCLCKIYGNLYVIGSYDTIMRYGEFD